MIATIDIHTHILPERLPNFAERFGAGSYVTLEHHKPGCARMLRDGKFFREIQSNSWDPKVRISECDRDGVGIQVLSTVPVLFSYDAPAATGLGISQFLNDHIAEVVSAWPKRFLGLGTVPLQEPKLAVQELERVSKTLKLSGLQIGTNVNGANIGDKQFWPFWEAVEALQVPVFVHPWEMLGKERMPKYFLPWLVGMPAETTLAMCSLIFSGVWQRFSKLKLAFAHGGGSFPFTLGRIDHGFDARPDLCAVDCQIRPKDFIGKFYVDSLVHDSRALQFLVDVLGAESIAIGSDYPFPLGEDKPGALVKALPGISSEQKERLLYGTALEWLGLNNNIFADR